MRRNNDWLALLAVSVALSILRNSLAGERYPLDYDTAELPVNRSRTVYESRESNEPSLNSSSTPFARDISAVAQTPSNRPYVKEHVPEVATKAVSTNLLDNDDFDAKKASFRADPSESWPENPAESFLNPGATESGVLFAGESTGLGSEARERLGLSLGSHGAAIKDTFRLNHATRRRGEPAGERKTTTEGTIRGESEPPDTRYPYYGHVGVVSHDDDSLTTSGGQIGDVDRRQGTRDLRDIGTETSDKKSGLEAPNSRQEDIGWWKSSVDRVKEEKRYPTDHSVPSVPFNRRTSGKSKAKFKSKLDRLIAAGRSKDKRAGRSVYNWMSDRSRFGRSIRSSKKEESRTSDHGDAIDLESWFFSRDSTLSNEHPREERLERSRPSSHGSSRVEGSRHGAPVHKSTPARREAENARELNGISSKRRSTTRDDDLEDKGVRRSSLAPEQRDFPAPSHAVASDPTSREETSRDVTLRGTNNSPLANKTVSRVESIDEELQLGLPRNNLTDGNDAEPVASAFNDESDSTIRVKNERNESSIDETGSKESWNNETHLENSSIEVNPRFDTSSAKLSNEYSTIRARNERNESSIDITGAKESWNNETHLENSSIEVNPRFDTNSAKLSNEYSMTRAENERNESSIDKTGPKESWNNETHLENSLIEVNPRFDTSSAKLGNESNASWTEIDETQESSIKMTREETIAASNATEESAKASGNSLRDSIAAQRNATYSRRDVNSLAEASFVSSNDVLFRFDERNVNDPLGSSSTTGQGRRSSGNPKVNAQPEQSNVYKEEPSNPRLPPMSSEASNVSEAMREEEKRRNGKKIVSEAIPASASPESSSQSENSEAEEHEGSLNRSLIGAKDGNPVNPRAVEPLNQNTGKTANEIRANEPIAGSSVKNEKPRDSALDNRTKDTTNLPGEDKENTNDPQNRASKRLVSFGPVTNTNRPSRERKSRSSSVGNSTLSTSERDSSGDSMETRNSTASEASTPMENKDEARQSAEASLKIDLSLPKASQGEPARVTLNDSRKIVSTDQDRFTVWTNPTTKDLADDDDSLSEFNVSDLDEFPNETSTVALINDDEQALAFDTIVTSTKTTDEGLVVTIDDASSRDADNSSRELEPPNQWPVKHSAVVEGDLVLGGLMMVHEREDTITCGPVMPQGGVQALEAMLYTLDNLNGREIVPGVKIGAHILDDCDKDTYGLEMAVDFIKGSISNIDGAEYHCNKTAVRKVISGVVGAASSVTSIQVANLLRLFRIPQVSFFSTSPELSNKQRFEYFTRTIPSDHYQVKAMVDIVLTMGWSYVSIIYEESNYGIKAFEELEELLGKNDICIAIKEKLVKDSGVAKETAYDNIVLKLLTKPRARGCIIFGSDQEVAGVMRAVRRCNATGAFSWIGSDGWSARGLVSNGNEPEVEGTLSVQPQANPVKGFEEYFLNLTVENNRRNPWFVEFWEDHFQCRYPNASRTPYNQKYTKPCTTKERLTRQNTAFEDQLQFVSDAVMAFAYAFRDMHKDLCHGKPGLCDAMKPTKGTELLRYLRRVNFEGLSGDKFKFDKNGDGPARYNIIHFKQIEPGKYKWIRVGKYLEGELKLNMSEIQFKLGHPQPPESVCSLPCEIGQAKKYVEGERCCWHCFNCTQYQIRHQKDETQCTHCRQGTVPDETHSTCRDIPEEFLRPESGWAIGAMSFSATGILITLFVCGVFLKHNDTPVVRASGRELSYVLLSGILLCYLVTFALVLRPTDLVCGIQRFAAGFCFTVVYAALLTKTNRISRIFNASKHGAKRPSFISPRSQLIICSGLVFVQILVNGVWMIIDPDTAKHHYPTREDNLLVCNSYIDASYMIAFAYPIMLIVVCTVYAVLTRKIPEAFNESKHIGFTMYTTCVIWLAFVPLYFGTGNNVALRITSMSVTISLSASVTIACLFSPKLYIILIRPERNVRQSMMPARYSTTKSSAVTATNASSMIAPVTLTAATCDQNKTVKKHITTTIDCSTQSEYYELEVKDQKNGKPPASVVSRSTQTSGNNDKDSTSAMVSSKEPKENTATTKQLNNNARIGNGPVNQSDVPL